MQAMKCLLHALFVPLACIPMIAQLSVPKIGVVRYSDGTLHSVRGLPSNILISDLSHDSVQAASFSDGGGLIFANGAIRLLNVDMSTVAEYPTSEKPLLAIDGELTSALVWLPQSGKLLRWDGSQFVSLDLDTSEIDGAVTGLARSGSKQAVLIIQRADNSVARVAVSLRTGNLVTSELLPGVRGYTFPQGSFMLFASDKELIADDLHGYRRSTPIPASDILVERMSSNWLHLYSPSLKQSWALHLTSADLDLSQLPGAPEQAGPSILANASQEIK